MDDKAKKIRLCPDKPIDVDGKQADENDLFGFQTAVLKLSQIVNNIETPFTIGIFGAWGSGKSSFMRLLQKQLEKDEFSTFWFDAWRYENEASIMMPLLTKLADVHEDRSNQKLFDNVRKVASVATLTGLDIFLKAATHGAGIETIEKNFKRYEDYAEASYRQWVSEIDNLEKDFAALVENVVGEKGALVVFIDDLDRCLPENSVKLIENIKHYLSAPKCIFVFGVDKGVIAKGIEARYGTQLISGEEYLDKVINLSFLVPDKITSNVEQYVFETARKMSEPDWFKSVESVVKALGRNIADCNMENAVRKINILIKRYLIFLAFAGNSKVPPERLSIVLILREFFPKIYELKKSRGSLMFNHENYAGDTKRLEQDFGVEILEEMKGYESKKYIVLKGRLAEHPFDTNEKCAVYFDAVDFIYSLS